MIFRRSHSENSMAESSCVDPQPGMYQHFKGGFYDVLGIAEDPETGKRYVVYRSLGLMQNQLPPDPKADFHPGPGITPTPTKGELSVCAIERFTQLVDSGEYHPGTRVPRFRSVPDLPGQSISPREVDPLRR